MADNNPPDTRTRMEAEVVGALVIVAIGVGLIVFGVSMLFGWQWGCIAAGVAMVIMAAL